MSESGDTIPWSKGTTARATKLSIDVTTGAILERDKLALLGEIGSFIANFKPSAKGCNNPNDPTTLGPFRRCTRAITLRSANTKKATPSRSGMIIPGISARIAMYVIDFLLTHDRGRPDHVMIFLSWLGQSW